MDQFQDRGRLLGIVRAHREDSLMGRKYQRGNLTLKPRTVGPDVWEFRWRDADGRQRSRLLGTVEEFRTERHAQAAADAIRLEVNSESQHVVPVTVATLIERYLSDNIEKERLAFSTHRSYKSFLNVWVKPKWGSHTLEEVKALAIEKWLRELDLAPKSKLHIRSAMHVLFECAARWELYDKNPIAQVRQGGLRQTEPEVLTPKEFQALLKELDEPYRTMVILAGCLGLACSEFIGLKWSDFDWNSGVLSVQRGVVACHVGKTKTLARRKPIPLAPVLLTVLREHRKDTAYPGDSDWVFASPYKHGKEPYWTDNALKKCVKPAAVRAGITKTVGWHSLRHMYSTLLRANGTDVKVQSDLLRHSRIQTTLDIYTQAVTEQKRSAHEAVVEQLIPA